jgi:hypothetical protein
MYSATAFVSAVLAALMSYAAARKVTHRPEVLESYRRAGVPEDKLDLLAIVLFVVAAGLLVGLIWAPIGIAAGAAALVYSWSRSAFTSAHAMRGTSPPRSPWRSWRPARPRSSSRRSSPLPPQSARRIRGRCSGSAAAPDRSTRPRPSTSVKNAAAYGDPAVSRRTRSQSTCSRIARVIWRMDS